MKRALFKFFILAGTLLGLPLLGVIAAGYPVSRYLEFPPKTRYIYPAPFSWAAFGAYALFILAVIFPMIFQSVRSIRRFKPQPSTACLPFPWWGWLGLVSGAVSWILAWTRFSWFAAFQPHTFILLWLSFILVVNALCYRQSGRCMMIDRTGYFLILFPASAAFWWFFEYLNRFVQNWHYTGVHYGALKYFCLASLSFATVLPAVLGAREWIASFAWVRQGFKDVLPLNFSYPKPAAGFVLTISVAGLTAVGVRPNYLYPLLWVSPLLIIVSLQALTGERHVLADIAGGDWRLVVSSALAALFCGGFWEMWNYFSLAKWEYSVPFVHHFQIFEMPLLGYAGYLPFGLECLVVGRTLERWG